MDEHPKHNMPANIAKIKVFICIVLSVYIIEFVNISESIDMILSVYTEIRELKNIVDSCGSYFRMVDSMVR